MRVLLVLLALVATPFLVSAAQDPHGLACTNGQGDANRSAQGQAHAHKGVCKPQPPPPVVLDTDLDGVPDNLDQCPGTPAGTTVDASGCAVQAPAPPPAAAYCPVAPASGGTGSIDGTVSNASMAWPNNGLVGWCVELSGTTATGGAVTAATVTDASGNYVFVNVPSGSYTVCEKLGTSELDSGSWRQTFPSAGTQCLNATWAQVIPSWATVGDFWGASWNNFANVPK